VCLVQPLELQQAYTLLLSFVPQWHDIDMHTLPGRQAGSWRLMPAILPRVLPPLQCSPHELPTSHSHTSPL
jgi:hypothetical protein